MNEAALSQSILKELTKHNVFAWKHWGGPIGKRGVPDILGVLPGGQALGIEVKLARGILSPEQERFLEDMRKRGALAFVARSIEDVTGRLRAVGLEPRQKDLFESSQNNSNSIRGGH